MKVIRLPPGSERSTTEDGAYRDVYYVEKVAGVRVDGLPIVPRLHDAWIEVPSGGGGADAVERSFYIVMEAFDGDMYHLAKRRFAERSQQTGASLYHEKELAHMFRIAVALGEAGVLHSDIKPDQYLYRGNHLDAKEGKGGGGGGRDAASENIQAPVSALVIIDFGFAGALVAPTMDVAPAPSPYYATLGWPTNIWWYACQAPKGTVTVSARDFPKSTSVAAATVYLNVVMLEMMFLYADKPFDAEPTLVFAPHEKAREPSGASVFGGVLGLDSEQYLSHIQRYACHRVCEHHVSQGSGIWPHSTHAHYRSLPDAV